MITRKRHHRYRVVMGVHSPKTKVSESEWTKEDALDFARHAINAGTMQACVERAVIFSSGHLSDRWVLVNCFRRETKRRPVKRIYEKVRR